MPAVPVVFEAGWIEEFGPASLAAEPVSVDALGPASLPADPVAFERDCVGALGPASATAAPELD